MKDPLRRAKSMLRPGERLPRHLEEQAEKWRERAELDRAQQRWNAETDQATNDYHAHRQALHDAREAEATTEHEVRRTH